MSPLIALTGKHKAYQCARCAAASPPGSASDPAPPLRVLQLYVTVATADGSPTPMRMHPLTVVLVAPPDSFAWGVQRDLFDTTRMQLAQPRSQEIAENKKAFVYNDFDSKALWCSAGAFRCEASFSVGTMEVIS